MKSITIQVHIFNQTLKQVRNQIPVLMFQQVYDKLRYQVISNINFGVRNNIDRISKIKQNTLI
jgi:hypothetical protein